MKNHAGLALLLAPLLYAAQARAADICEVILCQSGCFLGTYQNNMLQDAGCDKPDMYDPDKTIRVFAASMAPDPIVISCEPLGGGDHLCEAFPTGDFTYNWSSSGSISLPYPGAPGDNAAYVSCSGSGSGVLSVTVTSPTWTVGSRNKFFSCSGY